LQLHIKDREVIEALHDHPEGPARQEFALTALKIGVSALRLASGRLDADLIQREGAQLLRSLGEQLQQHTQAVHERVNAQLREYFDPQSGRFNERVRRLVSRDGELEQLLRRQIGTEDSELAKTLLAHFGDRSPLMKRLSPTESEGLLAALRGVVEEQLTQQRERVLREFSLDNSQGALSRLVLEISNSQGMLRRDLQSKIDEVIKEFSLDEENSALSRLVRNVDLAQRTIVREFSLDNPASAFSRLNVILRDTQGTIQDNLTLDDENSPLARLKRELLQLLREHSRENTEFREEVKATLAQLVTRRAAAEQTTHHGLHFEDSVGEFLTQHLQPTGDVVQGTGTTVGLIKNCKVGDFVVSLGPDCRAPGARIVLEAKEDSNATLPKALEEIQLARKNRGAQIGVFVFSAKTALPSIEPFARYGDDLVVVWNSDDTASDVYLKAALATARALCVRSAEQDEREAVDLEAVDRAILEIEKRSRSLEEIRKSAETIQSASGRILDRVQRTQDALERQVRVLATQVEQWRHASEA
jgi:hypothetical protein